MTGSALRTPLTIGLWAGIALASLCGSAQSAESERPDAVCSIEARPDRLQDLSLEGDLVLASLGPARLAGIRLPDAPPYRDQALAWLRERASEPNLVRAAAHSDRWGRKSVRIRSGGTASPVDWSHALVEAGLAITDAGLDDPFCQPELLALEATARERRLGLWADDRYKPMDVSQPEHLRDRIGSFILVEGRVRSIGERKQRTYLNFGGHWAEDFTIIIPRKTWKQMSDRGMSAEALKG